MAALVAELIMQGLSGTTSGSDLLLALLLCFAFFVMRIKGRPPEVCGVDPATQLRGKLEVPFTLFTEKLLIIGVLLETL